MIVPDNSGRINEAQFPSINWSSVPRLDNRTNNDPSMSGAASLSDPLDRAEQGRMAQDTGVVHSRTRMRVGEPYKPSTRGPASRAKAPTDHETNPTVAQLQQQIAALQLQLSKLVGDPINSNSLDPTAG